MLCLLILLFAAFEEVGMEMFGILFTLYLSVSIIIIYQEIDVEYIGIDF
jgi:hypothetical protein